MTVDELRRLLDEQPGHYPVTLAGVSSYKSVRSVRCEQTITGTGPCHPVVVIR